MRQLKITRSITNRETQSLEKYLQEISKLPLLSPDEEFNLFLQVKNRCELAKEKLVKANLRFVVSVAKQFQGQGMTLEDLINEGNVGLIKSVERFDASRGFKFISFAVWWIRQSILQAIGEKSRMVKLPLNKVLLGGKINKMKSALEQALERNPSEEELAEALDMTTVDVSYSLDLQNRHVSFDAPTTEDEDTTFIDSFMDPNYEPADRDLSYRESLKTELARTMAMLNERQREVLCCYFGIGQDHAMGLEEIGRIYDLTPERVRQIKDKALVKLRNHQSFRLLSGFLRA